MLRETRKKLPIEPGRGLTAREYAVAVEVALKREIGTSRLERPPESPDTVSRLN